MTINSSKRVPLVAGGSGIVGRAVTTELSRQGWTVGLGADSTRRWMREGAQIRGRTNSGAFNALIILGVTVLKRVSFGPRQSRSEPQRDTI